MALSEMEENDIKVIVLLEVEKMFTAMSYKYNIQENREMMLFLLDIESKMKASLLEVVASVPKASSSQIVV